MTTTKQIFELIHILHRIVVKITHSFNKIKIKSKHLIIRITYHLMMIIYNQTFLHHIPKNIANKERDDLILIIEFFLQIQQIHEINNQYKCQLQLIHNLFNQFNQNVYSNNSSGKPLPNKTNYTRNQSPYNSSYRGRSPEQRITQNSSQNHYTNTSLAQVTLQPYNQPLKFRLLQNIHIWIIKHIDL